MPDPEPINIEFSPPDPDEVYANYLKTCTMLGITPVPPERARGLLAEWNEVLAGRPDPTQH